ncbi:hypothetical protein [Myroides marinus]|uniref:hypothetical protein n=1 Tax=Myroides marinus TaxID=703342 RepID=UPI002578511F|nr:hypothetical protein [Myroides marinus]MDM1361474.1 hypothetical protein [Myroides marinus]
MKKLILSATVAFTVLTTSNIYAQQGFGTNTPDRSSAVEIVSSKRGLLIPRLELKDTKIASPVSKPANALFVYNTATAGDVTPGFYYWETTDQNDESKGRWVRFVSSNSGSAVEVKAGANVKVDKKVTGHDTEYTISVPSGTAPNQVYVTVDSGEKDDKGNIIYKSTWVNPEDFINGAVVGENGIKTNIKTVEGKEVVTVGLGGALNSPTEIKTTIGADGKPANTLAITGLETLVGKGATTGNKFNSTDDKVVVMGADGILKNVSAKDLVEDAIDNGAINGKALTSKGNSIQIEGDVAQTALLKDVNIEVKGGEKEGQILVSTPKLDDKGQPVIDDKGNPVYVTKWVDAAGNTVKSGQGVTVKEDNTVNLGGKITNNGTTPGAVIDLTDDKGAKAGDIAIKGLEELVGKDTTTGTKLDTNTDKLVVADKDGILKQTSTKNLIEDAIEKGGLTAKPLSTDGKIVIGTNKDSKLDNAVLVETHLSIKEGSITTTEIADGTIANVDLGTGVVSADKMTSNTTANGTATPADKGQIPVADGKGGVTYQQVTGDLLNGKALTSPTGSISVSGSGAKALLDATTIDIKGGTVDGQVLVTEKVGDDFVTKWVTPTDLGNTVTASNGLTKTGNDITLGGAIDTPTTLAIDNTKGSLSITGLGTAAKDKTNKTVVVQADGKLATVDTAAGNVTINQGDDVNISDNSVVNNYHPSMSEIVIEVTLGDTDTNLNLPAVNGTEGQTISVKIVNTKETHKGYLVIKDDKGAFLSEGAMPFQGWIIKSNGTKWIVVGRN